MALADAVDDQRTIYHSSLRLLELLTTTKID